MYCPRTKVALEETTIGDIKVYLSPTGGVFFDNRQIFHFSDPRLKPAQVLVAHLQTLPPESIDLKKRIHCPKCPYVVMMRRFFTPLRVVEIDECPNCAAIWLDNGELEKIHENHLTPKEREMLRIDMANNNGFIQVKIPKRRHHIHVEKSAADENSNLQKLAELAYLSLLNE
ncbi:zf-TFIIB domain-containing protein (plasmid) [Pseudoalteromonas sp. CF6-2]|uniref:TFIIB-type zinc ribbon-containing protein n=1 Tax=Pseudoalteromonas TaxID=53246 RepID=UPI000784508F|nr:zf-TFIIB domain-containing protein [Pseudoalteromonas arabiensis]UJX27536.1 zf-TFIIB domain-containing protein [Pseudoalteromonas sp. CF6-2]